MVEELSLAQLVSKAQGGEASAFEKVYSLTNNKIYYLALKMVKNPDDALDIVQDSYIAAFSKINTLQNPEAFLSWMYRITANNCNKFFINNKKTIFFNNEDDNPLDNISEENYEFLPQDAIDNAESRRLIMNIVDNLPDAQRTCIILYYFSEMSVSEIAEIMECSEGTIKSRLNYGRKYIKQAVLDLEEKEGTRLYTFLPFGAIAALFQDIPEDTFSSTQYTGRMWDEISSRISKPGTTTVSTVAGSTASGAAKAGILATIKAKVIAGIIGVTVAVSGATMIVNSSPALSFEDPAFEAGIRAAINRPTGEIYKKDLEKVWGMEVTEEGFKFVQGHEEHLTWLSEEPSGSIEKTYSLKDAMYLNKLDYFAINNVSIDTFEPLSATGVKNLILSNADADDWDSLGSLSDLNNLHISYSLEPPFNKLPSMSGLKELKSFRMSPNYMDDNIVPMDISSISEAESLVMLELSGVIIKDLSPLSKLKKLKALELNSVTIYDVTPLAGLNQLMAISIGSTQQIEGRETFRSLPALEILQVYDSPGISLSEDEWAKRQMDIEGVVVNYNHFGRNIGEEYRAVMNKIHESIKR
ncbi:RNA polymerase sigma factor, sigma-70 family [Proteiniborus ethanoligenes]|uniref:RNA polymerase sigma factor, sigma-70 family n=1 Tax=Proteiniborus ethanoligenes TaxID=415015 RepID=A0A1H3MUC4_9FIRM|nr:sigma-70 family RNA polymerase sigma factor [Proteiniborus ethanoligenes]SDY80048.1 RNA polymerase sigma factor, sigma-70 family [Proteiniborus ethanoligenes]